jgi:TolB-like protein/Tfp pilus assembly protein PilF
LSPQKNQEYFCDGMTDDIIIKLSQLKELKVISRTSVMHYRDTEKTIPEIARELSVATILEGGVQRSGDHVRINVQLIDAHTDEHLWAETYDRELSAENMFAIQSEISTSIAEALNATLSPEEHARVTDLPTISLEANDHYMRGRQLMINRQTDELLLAVTEFEAAVEIDPEFALAWVGVADTLLLLASTGAVGFEKNLETRVRAVDKALALNDQLGETYTAYGDVLAAQGFAKEARVAHLKAIELAPNYALAYHRYAMNLAGLDNLEQRVALYQKAIQLDPFTPVYQDNLAVNLSFLGRDEEAMQLLERLLEWSPEYSLAFESIGFMHFKNGRISEAIDWSNKALRMDPVNARNLMFLAQNYVALGDYEAVAQIRQWMVERLNPGNIRVLWLDFSVLMRQRDWQAALDYIDAFPESMSTSPGRLYQRGLAYYFKGDLFKSREYWSTQSDWPAGEASDDCMYVHVLMATGDEVLGRELLDKALNHFEITLPRLTQHTDQEYQQGVCYLVAGDYEKALDFFDRRATHGHFTDWWEIQSINLWDGRRDDPRFIALGQKTKALIAEQRELLQIVEESPG